MELKIKIGEALLELSGSKEEVDSMYDKIKNTFISSAAEYNSSYIEKAPAMVVSSTPTMIENDSQNCDISLSQLKLRLKNASERDWFLIYLYVYSEKGQKFVSMEDFKSYYLENRHNRSSVANYSNTLKSAVDFLKFDNNLITINQDGIQRVYGLNDGSIKLQKNTDGTKKSSKPTNKFNKIDLNLVDEASFVDEYNKYNTKSVTEKIYVLLKMYRDKTNIEEFSIDLIHSLLDLVSTDTPASLVAMMNNFVNIDKTFDRPERNIYKFKYKGIDKAKSIMDAKDNQ